ncbi:hypothetical protein B0H10DRAFT_1975695 [Mycena sp. CBHHK59/15]|nr:hypothetical protein B0H10DRAFT_1975695 [Mycena sp. CBHHK59/15]
MHPSVRRAPLLMIASSRRPTNALAADPRVHRHACKCCIGRSCLICKLVHAFCGRRAAMPDHDAMGVGRVDTDEDASVGRVGNDWTRRSATRMGVPVLSDERIGRSCGGHRPLYDKYVIRR